MNRRAVAALLIFYLVGLAVAVVFTAYGAVRDSRERPAPPPVELACAGPEDSVSVAFDYHAGALHVTCMPVVP